MFYPSQLFGTFSERDTQMDLELSLEKDGKMLKKIGFKKCGHRICMIKDHTECGICGKKYTKGTGKYYTSEFMDQNEKKINNEEDNMICQPDISLTNFREKTKQMDLKLSLERDGKMLKKIGFKKCGHRICMIKDPEECGICGKKYTRGTGKYYTPEFMDQNEKISDKVSDTESGKESDTESDTESDKESVKVFDIESEEEELDHWSEVLTSEEEILGF